MSTVDLKWMIGATVLSKNEERIQGYVKKRELNFFPVLEEPDLEIYGEL